MFSIWKKIVLIVVFIVFSVVCWAQKELKTNYVKLTAFNCYKLDVSIEIKCDWNGIKKQYRFYKKITIFGKKNTTINVPNNLNSCELWPKIKWW